mmetsp:Transcript_9330/g.18414  ORF Transcript_9330/g.18414 Transcript_9330/m.18414 type:complete len:395 (+) Transcript_9330:759-1943(+)|eukprot:CAMPEP_0171493984 /NCGR_PEP_ID=MMETSP0958-20121227/5261_1 /TAXON_ID=87120 /ORGANISM="Aurantiochytrium limacinum, Strain ATCCMYA-1381" /LENGTH=394 /DNA_ID=CAMNT_0012027659 /DNA_START=650 /DNA_END=1834 /DNA_ORIENTATION=+
MGDLDDLPWSEELDGDNLFSGVGDANNGSGHDISRKLRTASEMHQNGLLSNDEKATLKQMVLQRDTSLDPDFANLQSKSASASERKSSYMNLKSTLRKNSLQVNMNSLSMSGMDLLGDDFEDGFNDMIDPSVFDDFVGGNSEVAFPPPGMNDNGAPPSSHEPNALTRKASTDSFRRKSSFQQMQPNKPPSPALPQRQPSPAPQQQQLQQGHMHTAPQPQPQPQSQSHPQQSHMQPGPSQHAQPRSMQMGAAQVHLQNHRQTWLQQQARQQAQHPHMYQPIAPLNSGMDRAKYLGSRTSAPMHSSDSLLDDGSGDPSSAKEKKNERERRRRLQVSQGFTDLFKLLKMPEAVKMEKSTVLNASLQRIRELDQTYKVLQEENRRLRAQAANLGIKTD